VPIAVVVYILTITTTLLIGLLVIVLLLYKTVTLLEQFLALLVRIDGRAREVRPHV
jgi:hypothetical protein